jgi:hypothetical protein
MAWMNQERKAPLVAAAKKVLKKYGVKATFSTSNSSISCNIKSGPLDFISNYNKTAGSQYSHSAVGFYAATTEIDVNVYHYDKHFDGKCRKFLGELIKALNVGNHDNSDIQTDYFDVGWYVNVHVGKWNKPYVLER